MKHHTDFFLTPLLESTWFAVQFFLKVYHSAVVEVKYW